MYRVMEVSYYNLKCKCTRHVFPIWASVQTKRKLPLHTELNWSQSCLFWGKSNVYFLPAVCIFTAGTSPTLNFIRLQGTRRWFVPMIVEWVEICWFLYVNGEIFVSSPTEHFRLYELYILFSIINAFRFICFSRFSIIKMEYFLTLGHKL